MKQFAALGRLKERRTASGLIAVEHARQATEPESKMYVRQYDYGTMKGRDRNKPCPCGSGRKFKRCHGDRIEA